LGGSLTGNGDLTIAKTGEPALIVNNTSDHKAGLIIGENSKNAGLWDYTNSKWIVYSTAAGAVTLNGNANGLVDGSSTMTSAYNKAGLNYGDYTWLAGWNGYELRAVNKNQFAKADQYEHLQTIDLSSQNVNTWYPVCTSLSTPSANGFHRIRCAVELDSGTKPSWSSHTAGFTAIVEILTTACGWGTTNAKTIVLQND